MIHGIFYRKPNLQHFEETLRLQHLLLNPNQEKLIQHTHASCWLAQAVDDIRIAVKQSERYMMVAWARLDNRDELCTALKQSNNISDAELILKLYEQEGVRCTKNLFGDFSFAIFDQQQQILFCARDQMGVKPFYYYLDDDYFIFSSSFNLFHALDCINLKPSMEWASKFLLSNLSMDFEKTAYQNIAKLRPASQLTITRSEHQQKQYFEFHTNKYQFDSFEDYLTLYQNELERAIKTRIQTNHPLGSENSGGIDSSTITSYAAKYFEQPLSNFYTFSFAHLEEEPQHILSVCQQYNLKNNFICCEKDNFSRINHLGLNTLGAPIEHGNAIGHIVFYEIAQKHGVRTLLSGFGGDEFVTSLHGNLALYELFQNKHFLTLYQKLAGNFITRPLRFAKVAKHMLMHGGIVSKYMHKAFQSRWPFVVLSERCINAYNLKRHYDERGKFLDGYNNLDRFTLENRHASFVPTRLENCTLMAAAYGIDYRWPLLDARLIQCFLSIPSTAKYHRGIGRYLHRRAIDKIVPDNITWKPSKAMGNRISSEISRNINLNKDLHPSLMPLINLTKLNAQAQRLKNDASSISRIHPFYFQAMNNIQNVNKLDNWLKIYFPGDSAWVE